MILLSTDEARVVSAYLEYGAPIVELMSDGDKARLTRARNRLADHTLELVNCMAAFSAAPERDPAA